jgi:hypothetical protein
MGLGGTKLGDANCGEIVCLSVFKRLGLNDHGALSAEARGAGFPRNQRIDCVDGLEGECSAWLLDVVCQPTQCVA